MATRPITLTVVNQTGETVTVADLWHNHGTQPEIQPVHSSNLLTRVLRPGEQCDLYAKATGTIGPQGGWNIYIGDPATSPIKAPYYEIYYNHPYGREDTVVRFEAPSGFGVNANEDLQHHESKATYTLTKNA